MRRSCPSVCTGWKATRFTTPVCPRKTWVVAPRSTSKTMTVVSADADATRPPLRSYASSSTGNLWPFHTRSMVHVFSATSSVQLRNWRLRPAVTSCLPSSRRANAVNSSASAGTVSTAMPDAVSITFTSAPHGQTRKLPSRDGCTLPPVYKRPWRETSVNVVSIVGAVAICIGATGALSGRYRSASQRPSATRRRRSSAVTRVRVS